MIGPLPLAPDYEERGWEDGFGEISFYNRFPAGPRKDATYQKDYFLKNDPKKFLLGSKLCKNTLISSNTATTTATNWAMHSTNDWWGSATTIIIRYP